MPAPHSTCWSSSHRKLSRTNVMRAAPIALVLTAAVLVPAVPAHAAAETCQGVKATIVGFGGVIRGTSGRDVIVGSPGNDTIFGRGGKDLVCGGDGADHLHGGAGNDRLYGQRDQIREVDEDGFERDGDTLSGGPGNDRLDTGSDTRPADVAGPPDAISWEGSAHGVHIDLRTGTARGEGVDTFTGGTFTITGSAHGDIVEGTNHRDQIDTGNGPDIVRGRGGDDIIVVDDQARGAGNEADQAWGGDGDDQIASWHGRDHLNGGTGDDFIRTRGASNDVVNGGDGDDGFSGDIGDTAGQQSFNGGPGNDGMEIATYAINPAGAASTGTYDMATGAVTFTRVGTISFSVQVEQARLSTKGTSWTVTGTSGDDSLFMAQQAAGAHFSGLAGDDTFLGSHGNDVFDGGPGNDSANMWDGDDTCISVEVIDDLSCDHIS